MKPAAVNGNFMADTVKGCFQPSGYMVHELKGRGVALRATSSRWTPEPPPAGPSSTCWASSRPTCAVSGSWRGSRWRPDFDKALSLWGRTGRPLGGVWQKRRVGPPERPPVLWRSSGSTTDPLFLDTSDLSGRYSHLERHRAGDTAVDVASWLRDLGLERYEAAFRENDVSAEDLCHLTAEDLEGLGVTAIGHRRRLLVAIAKLDEQRPPSL